MYVCCLLLIILLNIVTYILENERPQLKDINNSVVTRVATKWKQLGRNLEIDDNLLTIIETNSPHDCESCCSDMLSEWLDLTPNASWKILNNAIDKTQEELNGVPDAVEKINNAADKLVKKLDAVAAKLPDTMKILGNPIKTVDQLVEAVNIKMSRPVDSTPIAKEAIKLNNFAGMYVYLCSL